MPATENQAKIRRTKDMRTKLGMAMKTMTMVEMTWSVNVFFFSAAQIPKRMPNGTDRTAEIKFKRIEYPIRCIMMTEVDTLGCTFLL